MFATDDLLRYSQVLSAWVKGRCVAVSNRGLTIRLCSPAEKQGALSPQNKAHWHRAAVALSSTLWDQSRSRAQEPLVGSGVLWSLGNAQLSIMHLKQFCVQKSLLVIVRRETQPQRDGF